MYKKRVVKSAFDSFLWVFLSSYVFLDTLFILHEDILNVY